MKRINFLAFLACPLFALAPSVQSQEIASLPAESGTLVFTSRDIPAGVPLTGQGENETQYGYRIPSLLTTSSGTMIAFAERRLGRHDHAQNDIVLKRSTDGGQTWGPEIVVHEDGPHSINDPLSVQLDDGRLMMIFARFPYGRHARNAGWIKMAEPGYDDPQLNVLTFLTHSSDDGVTWSPPRDISRSVKPEHWINANSPGAMIQLKQGSHKGRIIAPLWGTVPPADGSNDRIWEIVVAHSDDHGTTWSRTAPLDDPEEGFPNECQVAEASDGRLVLVSRNQGGQTFRKKAFSHDSGVTWSVIQTDPMLPSVACMGSVISGPQKPDGSWDLYASFPSDSGRQNGQIAVSEDNGQTFEIRKIVAGPFAYSATQISPDGKYLLCLYEFGKDIRFLSLPLRELE